MISTSPPLITEYREYVMLLIAIVLVAVGFKYAKDVIAFVLDKLYQFFIQNNHTL
ncbi:MAG: hypothetical protein ACM3VS_08665 [Candidatus Dadabacteria bacterium]